MYGIVTSLNAICMYVPAAKLSKTIKVIYSGADPGFSEGGVRIRGGYRREELALVLYL